MNRERLTILRDHLESLPDERVDMSQWPGSHSCGTAACIGGWAERIFDQSPYRALGLSDDQSEALFYPLGWSREKGRHDALTRSDAIAAIQSMLDSPDDDALPVWPSREGASA